MYWCYRDNTVSNFIFNGLSRINQFKYQAWRKTGYIITPNEISTSVFLCTSGLTVPV